MLAAGWRLSERAALRAVRTAAARAAHEAAGLKLVRPERVWPPDPKFRPGMSAELRAGAVACRLVPALAAL
jgi:hypothetical protein